MAHVAPKYVKDPGLKKVSRGSVSHPTPLSSGKWSPKITPANATPRSVKLPL